MQICRNQIKLINLETNIFQFGLIWITNILTKLAEKCGVISDASKEK